MVKAMASQYPNILQMARAPFLSSILSPIIAGTLLAVGINQKVNVLGFLIVLIIGIGLHVATNVYNDIYDTKQGTDRVNVHRNPFSGGSGILVRYPEMMQRMYWLARTGLAISLVATLALTMVIDRSRWPYLWGLYVLAAFFSKFYTAAPIKLAYRGLGEIAVWFAFGPMAILMAALGQNIDFHRAIVLAMPITGISTLSILLLGQMIDREADQAAGKWGVAVRLGNRATSIIYLLVQILLCINVGLLAFMLKPSGWIILIAWLPYGLLLPRIVAILRRRYDQPDELKAAAQLNVQLHLLFSLLLSLSIGATLIIG